MTTTGLTTHGALELSRAGLLLTERRFDQAHEACDRALDIFTRAKARAQMAEAYKLCGILFRERGKPDQAHTHFAVALGLAEVCGDRRLEAETRTEWALLHMREGRKREAVLSLNRALATYMAIGAYAGLGVRRDAPDADVEQYPDRLVRLLLQAAREWADEITAAKDRHQADGSRRVADLSVLLGRALGIHEWDLTRLYLGALVRDMGNLVVPAEVLGKTEVLNRQERELVQVHTVIGDAMVSQMHFPPEIRPAVRNHHEHWDGTGYPDHLTGDAIPLAARIVCVADVYSALTSARSYRPPFARDEALRIMERNAGRVFDPVLFATFRELVERR